MKKLALLSLFSTLVTPALAGNLYFSGAVGQAYFADGAQMPEPLLESPFRVSDTRKATAYKLQLGYRFNEYFALEGGYVNLGKSSRRSTLDMASINAESSTSVQGMNLLAVGILPLGERFALLGKAGVIYASGKTSTTLRTPRMSASKSDSGDSLTPAWGVGAMLNLNKRLALRADFDQYRNQGVDGYRQQIDLLSLGVNVNF